MSPREPESPRSVIMVAAVVSAVSLSVLRGQEAPPLRDARVDARADGAAVFDGGSPSVEEKRDGGWDLGVIIATAYNSNIALTKNDAKSDVVVEATPVISYGKGAEGGFIRFAYKPTGVVYLQGNADSRVDQEASLAVGQRRKATSYGYEGSARRRGDATADVGRQNDRTELEQALRVAWTRREKLELALAVGHGGTWYDDDDLMGSREVYGELAMRYAYSPKTRVAFSYRAGRFSVDGSSDQTIQRVGGGLEWQPREKVRASVEAGMEHRSFANGSSVKPVLEGRLEWTPKEGTTLYVAGYQREEASAFFAGQNYRVTGAAAGISQRIGNRWTAKAEVGAERSVYRQVEGAGGGGREDEIWFVRPALEYRFTDSFGMELFYRMSENRSNRAGFGYEQDMAGIRLNYQF